MPGGYTGQLVALNAITPTEALDAAARASQLSSAARVANVTEPYQISRAASDSETAAAQAKANKIVADRAKRVDDLSQTIAAEAVAEQPEETVTETVTSPLAATAAAPAKSPLDTKPLFTTEVEEVIQSIDPADPKGKVKWDDAMSQLAKTQPQAQQFIGQFSRAEALRDKIAHHEVAQIPQAVAERQTQAAAAPAPVDYPTTPASELNERGPRLVVSPITGKGSEALTRLMAEDPVQAANILKGQSMAAYQRTGDLNVLKAYAPDVYQTIVGATTNLNEEQRKQATYQFETIGRVAEATIEAGQKLGPDAPSTRRTYESGIRTLASMGLLKPEQASEMLANPKIDWARLAEGRAQAYTVVQGMEQMVAEQRAAAAANPANLQYVGTGPNGLPVNFNPDTGQYSEGNIPLTAKPGENLGNMMTPEQMVQNATNSANDDRRARQAEIDAAVQAGTPPPRPFTQAELDASYAKHLGALQAAGRQNPAAPAGGGATTDDAPRLTQRGFTTAQHEAATTMLKDKKIDPSAALGTRANPRFPKSAAAIDAMANDQWYVDHRGILKQKGK